MDTHSHVYGYWKRGQSIIRNKICIEKYIYKCKLLKKF